MNAKKFLKEHAERDKREILAQNGEKALRALEENVQPNGNERVRRKKWISAAAGTLAAIVLVTCIAVYRPWENAKFPSVETPSLKEPFIPEWEEIRYGTGGGCDFATFENANAELTEFYLQCDPDAYYYCNLMRAYDFSSDKTEFYSLALTSLDLSTDLRLLAGKTEDYDYAFWDDELAATTVELPNYTVTYYQWKKYETQFKFNVLYAIAKIEKGDETVYVSEYSEILDPPDAPPHDPDGAFLEVLQSVLK